MAQETLQTTDGQTRLIKHFEAHSLDAHTQGWSNLWDTDNSNLWDRGTPSAALIDILEGRQDLFNPFTEDGRRKKALVPGCGKGYDVAMLALHGYDVYGLDVSSTGVNVAREYASVELLDPKPYNFGPGFDQSRRPEKGQITILEGDFFSSEWKAQDGGLFDLIYDYTFLCALHPNMRVNWAKRMNDLLAPTGHLVCLEFPLFKDPSLPGPPWGLKGVHWDLLAEGGDGIVWRENDAKGKGKGAFRRLVYVKPERSYMSGKGTDMLSVWGKELY
ncbi:thiol methyltransferase [Aspergillus avenaceus]|uniref:Thiol methyltransferase n=1 Tax=Aspergillus avenaceus TaxID=36643 RepID=A0A5N6TVA0_ASPAV|nr:thiol methyltransferase [Aspergillus avenaceus]